MADCPVNCLENPGSVDKIKWKCVECETDLKSAYDAMVARKIKEAEEKAAEDAARNKGRLSDEQIATRRRLAE